MCAWRPDTHGQPLDPITAGFLGVPHLAKGWEPPRLQPQKLPKRQLAFWVFLGEVRKRHPEVLAALRDDVFLRASGPWQEDPQRASLQAWAARFHLAISATLGEAPETMTAWDFASVPPVSPVTIDPAEYHPVKQRLRHAHAQKLPLTWSFELRFLRRRGRSQRTSVFEERPFLYEPRISIEFDPARETVAAAARRLAKIFQQREKEFRSLASDLDQHRQLLAFKATIPDKRYRWLAAKQVEGLTYEEIARRFRAKAENVRKAIKSAARLIGLKVRDDRRGRKPAIKESRPRRRASR